MRKLSDSKFRKINKRKALPKVKVKMAVPYFFEFYSKKEIYKCEVIIT